MGDLVLELEEFEALSEADQETYLELVEKDENAWTLTGRQLIADALADQVTETLYGGAAGGGKSEWILNRAWRKSREVPGHRTLILRTKLKELRRSIVARSVLLYAQHSPKDEMPRFKVADLEWHFPNGSVIEFGYCVAGDTPIAMADGSFKSMQDVRVGDYVETLEGPKRVSKHFHVGRKPSVQMTLPTGASVVASESHAVLLASGQWRPPSAPASCTAIGCRDVCKSVESMGQTYPWHGRPELAGHWGHLPGPEVGLGVLGSDSAQPSGWSLELGLHAQVARRSAQPHAPLHDPCDSSPQGWSADYSMASGPGGGQFPLWSADDLERTPSPSGADIRNLQPVPQDGQTSTPAHAPWASASYCHPYTTEQRSLHVDVHPALATIALVGEQDLWDMQVEDANHYVSYGGIVHQNCMTDEDVGQYLSAEYDMIAFDEATQFTQYQYELIRSRARSPISKIKKGARPHVIAATNPGSRGHAFFKGTFVDPTDRGDKGATFLERDEDDRWRAILLPIEEYTEEQREEFRHIAFIPSTVADNPHMPREYIMSLKTLPEKERRRMLEGDWDLPEGMFFTEFRRSITGPDGESIPYHVVPAFSIPDSWRKIEATDWGFANPFCTLWMAWDPDGRCYVYREVYASRLTVAQQANLVVSSRKPGEKIFRSYADPSCWAMRDTLNTADQWAQAGWKNYKAKNSRIDGWNRVREYFMPMDDGFPAVQIFDTCTNLIRTIPAMMHDDVNPEDLDTELEDHAVDAFRYGLMTRPLANIKAKPGLMDRATRHFDRMTRGRKSSKNRLTM